MKDKERRVPSRCEGVSIIVPCYNEEGGVEVFCDRFDKYVATLPFEIELVFVDDGSTDLTSKQIAEFRFTNVKMVQLIRLSRNFGAHAAIRAGITRAYYDICTWLGSDLQEPLELVPISYEKITKEEYDAVCFEKKTIKVSRLERFFSRVYSYMMKRFAVKDYSSGGTSTIVFGKKLKDYLNDNIEGNSSITLQILDAGFRNCTLSMDYGERVQGVSKWTLSKKIKLLVDSFVSFSFAPIRMVSMVGFILLGIGILVGILSAIRGSIHLALIGTVLFGFGITNVSLGIMAEYLWRTYDAARKRPVFTISDEKALKGYEANCVLEHSCNSEITPIE